MLQNLAESQRFGSADGLCYCVLAHGLMQPLNVGAWLFTEVSLQQSFERPASSQYYRNAGSKEGPHRTYGMLVIKSILSNMLKLWSARRIWKERFSVRAPLWMRGMDLFHRTINNDCDQYRSNPHSHPRSQVHTHQRVIAATNLGLTTQWYCDATKERLHSSRRPVNEKLQA